MNFSDLASIGAGAGEATSIEAGLFGAPAVDDTAREQADSGAGDTFAALLGLLVGPSPTPPLPPDPETLVASPRALAPVAAEITPDLMAVVTAGQVAMVADQRRQLSPETVPVPGGNLAPFVFAPVEGAALVTSDATSALPTGDTSDAPTVDMPAGAVAPLPFTRSSRVSLDVPRLDVKVPPRSAPALPIDVPTQANPVADPQAPTVPGPPAPGIAAEPRSVADSSLSATALPAVRCVAERGDVEDVDAAQRVANDPAVIPAPAKPAAIVQAVAQAEAATRDVVASPSAAAPPVSPAAITQPAQAPTGGGSETFEREDASGQPALPHPVLVQRVVTAVTDAPVLFSDALPAPVPVSPAAPAWLSPTVDDIYELPDLTPQIVRSVRMQMAGDVGHARVHLRPEHLGELVVDLRVDQGDVIATIRSDVREVREWIQARSEELRVALGAHGLELVHVAVNEREQPQGKRQQPEVEDETKQRKAKNPETGRVFEIAA